MGICTECVCLVGVHLCERFSSYNIPCTVYFRWKRWFNRRTLPQRVDGVSATRAAVQAAKPSAAAAGAALKQPKVGPKKNAQAREVFALSTFRCSPRNFTIIIFSAHSQPAAQKERV